MKDIKGFCKLYDLNVPEFKEFDYYMLQYKRLNRWTDIDNLIDLYNDLESKVHILLTENEIKQLIENYRELVSKEYTNENIDKVEILNFEDRCYTFASIIRRTEPLRNRNSLADLFYFKTRVFVNSSDLHTIRIKDIRKFKRKPAEFRALFIGLNAKVEALEKMVRNSAFEVFDEESQLKHYYISKNMLL